MTVIKDEMRQRFRRLFGIMVSAAVFAALFCGCTAEKTGSAETLPEKTREASETVLPDRIEFRTGSEYPYNAEEIMYLSGVRLTAYRENTKYSLCDLDGDGLSELIITAGDAAAESDGARETDGAAEITGIYVYAADRNAAVLQKTYPGSAENSALPEGLIWVEGTRWPDASLIGVAELLGDPGVRTDYYLSANYDWLSGQHVHEQGEIADDAAGRQEIEDRKQEMFLNRERYQGDDIQILRDYYDAAADWEKRDREGIGPVRKYFDAIGNVGSLPELTEYLTDPEADPFCILITLNISLDLEDTSSWILELGEDRFSVLPRIFHNSDPADVEAARQDFEIPVRHLLSKAGYPEEEIDRMVKETYALEDRLLECAWEEAEAGDEYAEDKEEDRSREAESRFAGCLPFDEFVSRCRHFPLKELLNAYDVSGGRVRAVFPQYMELLDEIWTEENLPALKAYLLTHTAYSAYPFLDLETSGCLIRGEETDEEFRKVMNASYQREVLSSRELLGVAEENAYMTYFADEEERQDITALCEEIRAAFREILENSDWLSPEGRKQAVAKLDSMTFSVLKPDQLIDSSYLAVDKEKSFLDNYARILVNSIRHSCALAGTERVPGDWRYDIRPEIATTVDNAFYYGSFNQFFILSGFVNEATYRKDMSPEEKLGKLGEVIGHELTHGFDPLGIQYDKDGNKVVTDGNPYGWLPEEDYKAFMERADRIAAYYSAIKPFPYAACEGERVWGEAAADIGGMAIGLKIAEKYRDFDYDRYFRSYAELWRMQSTISSERYDVTDEHPLRYLRINTVVQQFDKFLETYGVREGDLMYLASEDRIGLWTE